MKKLFQAAACILLTLSISTLAFSQDEKIKEKEKDKASKNKLNDYDEIVIKRKGDKGGKVTVEIKDDEVLVNGKPMSDFEDENISVRKNRVSVWDGNARAMISPSPFRESVMFGNKAFLGVTTEGSAKGAKITNITSKSAAAKVGLKEGDIITKIGDMKVEDHDDVTKAIGKHKPEDKVTVSILRDGKEENLTATLGKSNTGVYSLGQGGEFDFKGLDGAYSYSFGRGRIGLRAQDTEDGKGVKVLDVAEESLAEKAGIKEGDIITEFDGKVVNTADALADAARETKEKTSFGIKFNRDGKAQSAEIKIPKKLKTTTL